VLLENKTAVVYGGAGAIGGAVARAFAREGATVHLAGRTRKTLDAVAEQIRAAGGRAETAELDAYDEQAVDAHADAVVAASGRLDISMNVVQHGDVQGTPLVEMAVDDFLAPVLNGLRNHLPDRPGGGPAHGAARLRGDPGLRWLRRPHARLLRRRPAGRLPGDGQLGGRARRLSPPKIRGTRLSWTRPAPPAPARPKWTVS
jgi:NAD(P)-dependent dehydrogenase (short-subunit alcohol dehydrogenase family)